MSHFHWPRTLIYWLLFVPAMLHFTTTTTLPLLLWRQSTIIILIIQSSFSVIAFFGGVPSSGDVIMSETDLDTFCQVIFHQTPFYFSQAWSDAQELLREGYEGSYKLIFKISIAKQFHLQTNSIRPRYFGMFITSFWIFPTHIHLILFNQIIIMYFSVLQLLYFTNIWTQKYTLQYRMLNQ